MKKFVAVSIFVLLMVSLASLVHAKVIENIKIPTVEFALIPCTGDAVLLEGRLHILITETVDKNGGLHLKAHFQPMNLQGEVIAGPNEGAKYNGTGVSQDRLNLKKGETFTMINNYRMIGQGKAPNFMVHETWHVTVNANGEVTANFIKVKVTCKPEPAPAPAKSSTVATKWGRIKRGY
jgi:hypothetical protein